MTDGPAKVMKDLASSTFDGVNWFGFIGRMPESPDQAIVFTDAGGSPPNPAWRLDYPSVQARIRGTPNGYEEARAKANEVRDALLGLDSQDVSIGRLVSLTCLSDVGLIGYDSHDRPEFTVNFRAIIEPSTGANRDSL